MRVLSFLSQHGEAYYPNQSVNGMLNRIMSIFDPQAYVSLDLPAGQFPPFTLVGVGGHAGEFAGAAAARPAARRSGDRTAIALIDLSLMAVSCTMASPIAWEHHYGVTLPIYAVMLATCLGDRTRLIWLGISYVLVSTYVPVTNLLAGGPLNVLQSTPVRRRHHPARAAGHGQARRFRHVPPPTPCAAMSRARPMRAGCRKFAHEASHPRLLQWPMRPTGGTE